MTAYRNDLDALSTRHSSLANELAEKTQELADATRILEEARAQAKRAVLDNIHVATPCSMDWDAMTGDERVRSCDACDKNVFNLSGMTREEAEELILEKHGNLCVRYFQRHDGTILLQDCSVGISQKRKRKVLAVGATLLLGGAALFAWKVTRKGAPTAHVEQTSELLGQARAPAVEPRRTEPDPVIVARPPVDPIPPVVPEPVLDIRGRLAVPKQVIEKKGEVHKMMGAVVLRKVPPSKTADVE
ncbi:MAG TPA: hypothetical protein VGM90_14710 [Kofleriaceae bacterium]